MPKLPMDETEFLEKKEKILEIAAEIVMKDGFQSLSMRKIGSRIGMTAANLYNYYANKDELNIAIRTMAGKILYDALFEAYHQGDGIAEKMALMIEAYIRFGIVKPNYYSILFDMPTPKYADYVGSPLEDLARSEKESTEQSIALMIRCMENLKEEGYRIPEKTAPFWIMIWGQIHGLISLYTNKLIAEVNDTPEQTLKEASRMAYDILFSQIGPAGRKGE